MWLAYANILYQHDQGSDLIVICDMLLGQVQDVCSALTVLYSKFLLNQCEYEKATKVLLKGVDFSLDMNSKYFIDNC